MLEKNEIESIAKSVLKERGLTEWVVTWVQNRGLGEWSVAVGDSGHHCPIQFQADHLTDELVRRFLNRGIEKCLGLPEETL